MLVNLFSSNLNCNASQNVITTICQNFCLKNYIFTLKYSINHQLVQPHGSCHLYKSKVLILRQNLGLWGSSNFQTGKAFFKENLGPV